MARSRPATNFVPKVGATVGNNAAENDEILLNCFVESTAYKLLSDPASSKMLASGRTGSGKTAILRRIKDSNKKSVEINPIEMSMDFLSNSTVLHFVSRAGADLDVLFQILWKHVLCVEYIRLRYSVQDESKWRRVVETIKGTCGLDPTRKRALEYLEAWGGKFWIPADQNVKEVFDKYSKKLDVEFSGEMSKAKGKATAGIDVSEEKRIEIIERYKKIVSAEQLSDLSKVIQLLVSDEPKQPNYFILIDRLDEHWVEDVVRFRMIRALAETLPRFRALRRLKIVVALRTDVIERVIRETSSLGFQREKVDDYICDLRWNKSDLKKLLAERVRLLGQGMSLPNQLTLEDALSRNVGAQDAFDYIFERTLSRPRDLISFFNECLKVSAASDANGIGAETIRKAEREYSFGRLRALCDEWRSVYPSLEDLLRGIGREGDQLTVADLSQKCDHLALQILAKETVPGDQIKSAAQDVYDDQTIIAKQKLTAEIIRALYRVGAIGLKWSTKDKFLYSHIDEPELSAALFPPETRIRLHPMLHRALNVSDSAIQNGSARRSA